MGWRHDSSTLLSGWLKNPQKSMIWESHASGVALFTRYQKPEVF